MINELRPREPIPQFERTISKLQKLENGEGWPYNAGAMAIALNAGLVGLVSNSYFRRMLKVRKLLVFTSLPMAVLPALSITPAWVMLISKPLVEGSLRCDICAQMRGVALNFTFGLIYPSIIAMPLVASIALRHKTVEVPEMKFSKAAINAQMKFWVQKSRFFKSQFISLALFQCVAGMYIAHKQYAVALEYVHKPKWKSMEELH
ncbi:transmembrane protein 126A-like [Anneissia japonica]|uniref:transmembrane protein 126A-like n=1 Tax=Anneissia japonica TaxID=1529436 RepID=UPI0014255C0F|nr:transmembrane protein 126A-like [Anneissia japonica]XP_033122581.1 transmembrane protein 126A-like [Anneissia japonica]XP_033122582.1 transmembrane protein 126A-like [Anneissia japonica]XP_033122583.1 transmembrane protein 126A-like [Anneissia japonica]XP_033122584.1 transmembrane protein 126A-like [Anneissia japonica]XP_033122585.1 transmembrane protein 126A-like [Anneissia japonica]